MLCVENPMIYGVCFVENFRQHPFDGDFSSKSRIFDAKPVVVERFMANFGGKLSVLVHSPLWIMDHFPLLFSLCKRVIHRF